MRAKVEALAPMAAFFRYRTGSVEASVTGMITHLDRPVSGGVHSRGELIYFRWRLLLF